jgi:ligand-binding SRPBCC domain-containing protein
VKTYLLERNQLISRPLSETFNFFARAENLERITPPWLHFRIRSQLPIEMRVDAKIDYTIRLAGVPLSWRTRITTWAPERCFIDVQERGPYSLWEHAHFFTPHGSVVLMTDRIRYGLPFGLLGRAANAVAVRSALAAIFDYRFQRIQTLLAKGASINRHD